MSLKVEIRIETDKILVGRFDQQKGRTFEAGSDERDATTLVLDRAGAVVKKPFGEASDFANDVLDGRGRPIVLILCRENEINEQSEMAFATGLEYPSLSIELRSNDKSKHPISGFQGNVDSLNSVIDILLIRGWRIFTIVAQSGGAAIMFQTLFARPHICRFLLSISGNFDILNEFKETSIRTHNGANVQVDTSVAWQFKMRALPRALPVLIIHGSEDNIVPVNYAANTATLIPNHTLQLISGAGHSLLNERTDEVISIANKWLNEQTLDLYSFFQAHCTSPPYFGIGRCRVGKEKAGKAGDGGVASSLVEGVLNFRDFGGYPVRDGRIVRWEHLYRSGKLNAITERGKRQLLALGVSRTIDLRNAGEAEREPTPAIDLVERAHCPVFAGQIPPEEVARRWKLYTEGGDPGFAEAYMIICESATSSYAQYLRHILLTKEPIVVHCTAGKDRTGVFAALLLKFLEVDEDLIVRDYSLTESMLFWSDQELRDLVEASKGLINMEGVKDLLASRPGALRLFFMKFAETYGTVQQYYEVALGLSKTELAELKDFLVLQPPFSYPPFQNLVTRY